MMRLDRADRSLLGEWWRTIDRRILAASLILVAGGLLVSLAATTDVASRIGYHPLHFVHRHFIFVIPTVGIMLLVSMFRPSQIRRLSLIIFASCILAMIYILIAGVEIKGASRWIRIAGLSLQPSEFVKPSLIVLSAWLFSEAQKRTDVYAAEIASGLFFITILLLILQPDYGQSILLSVVYAGMLFLAGVSILVVITLILFGLAGLWYGYIFAPHVARRIEAFLFPGSQDNYQTDKSIESFLSGGWMGRGPGEGVIKKVLPDAHADFVFSVIGEEYGILAAMGLISLFIYVVWRTFRHTLNEQDRFRRLCVTGLIIMFSMQALIHIYVGLGLLPAKGMTLPFLSYGGSSLVANGYIMGIIIALTRRKPRALFGINSSQQ